MAVQRTSYIRRKTFSHHEMIHYCMLKVGRVRPTGKITVMITHDGSSIMIQTSTECKIYRCGMICKNERGLKIHTGETEERQGPVSYHSTQNIQAH